MREMKDSGLQWIGSIPHNWVIRKLKYLFSSAKGLSITKADLIDKGLPVINYGQIHSKNNTGVTLLPSFLRFIPNSFGTGNSKSKVQKYDFVFADTSEDYEGCGNCVYKRDDSELFAGYHTIILHSLYKEDRRFFAYLFSTDCWRKQIRENCSGIKVFSITQDNLRNSFAFVPPLSEQKKIADYLDSKCSQIDSIIEKQKQIIEKLKEYKTSLITEVVTKGLDPNAKMKDSGVEWIGNYPQNWSLLKLKHNFGLKGRIGWQGLRSDEFIDDGPFLITGTDFVNGYVNWNTCAHISEERYMQDSNIHIKENDLLITKDGTIGKVAIVKNCPPQVSLNSGVAIIRHTGLFPCFSKYFYYILKSNQFDLWFKLSDNGNSTIKHLTQEKFYNFIYTCPPEIEQRQIADYLDSKLLLIDESIAKKEQIIEKLQEYKKSLIYEVVTGKREV